ncbi:hypothetical protein F4824DRAFT_473387 [Ustulina deusta]|nr:hypothetical protein F4824DRAFT_473387 [Ustulina deusta]
MSLSRFVGVGCIVVLCEPATYEWLPLHNLVRVCSDVILDVQSYGCTVQDSASAHVCTDCSHGTLQVLCPARELVNSASTVDMHLCFSPPSPNLPISIKVPHNEIPLQA